MSYMAFKHLHLLTVGISVVLFTLRGAFASFGATWVHKKWVRICAHGNDTVLLLAALSLCYLLGQWPFYNSGWITAKVLGLVAYIALGTLAIKRGQLWAYIGALIVVVYIALVAMQKTALPF